MSPEEEIQQIFIANGKTLSVAESCTGGALSARLTRLPGCSAYFKGALVAYSNQLKSTFLKISPDLLEHKGAVSQEVAKQMAQSMLKLAGTSYSLSVTGIAGPGGGTPNKPVGTIWIAIASQDRAVEADCLTLKGTREEIIQQTISSILKRLLIILKDSIK